MRGGIIIISALILGACSTAKRVVNIENISRRDLSLPLENRICALNMTAGNFNINKAEIEIDNNGKKQKLLATLKYRLNGNYLISVRNRTGIEAARIYITKDTVLINDRIYKKLYRGSKEYLLKKYGLSTNAIPLLFGDYIINLREKETVKDCKDGISEIQGYLENKEIWYYVDCNKDKVTGVSISDKTGAAGINMKFSNFLNYGNKMYPEKIVAEDARENTKISIKINSVDYNADEDIELIPGRNYEEIILR